MTVATAGGRPITSGRSSSTRNAMPDQYAMNCVTAVRAMPKSSTSNQSKTTLLSMRRLIEHATPTRPRPTSPQPPRVLPTAPTTGTTRLSQTPDPTNDQGCVSDRSHHRADRLWSRLSSTGLCCPQFLRDPVRGQSVNAMPPPHFPCQKGARSRRGISVARSPVRIGLPPRSRRYAATFDLRGLSQLLRSSTATGRNHCPTAPSERRSSVGLGDDQYRRRSARGAWSGTKHQARCDPTG